MNPLREILDSRELFGNLVMRELRSKYKATVFGWLWSLINPLAQVVVFTFVAKVIFRVQPLPGANGLDLFPVWVLCGILPWTYFTTAVTQSMLSIVGNANLIQKSYFPRSLLVSSTTVAQAATFGIEMLVLLVVLTVVGAFPLLWVPLAAVAVVLLICFATGFGLLLAVANVYFRDTSHLIGIVLQVWFYLTPVIYPVEQVQTYVKSPVLLLLYKLNPMYQAVEAIRDALYYQTAPSFLSMAYFALVALGCLLVGWLVFHRFEPRLAEEL